jgi:cell division protein FtsB
MRRSRHPAPHPGTPTPVTAERVGRAGARLLAAGMLVLSLWMLASFVGQLMTSTQLERRREALEAEISRIEAENDALRGEVAYAESPAYAEKIAREQLGYAREGDVIILPTFPQTTPTPDAPTPGPLPTPTPRANWRGWGDALFPTPAAP